MAIDPSISLAVRPVQMPVPNIQSPVDRLAQVLSLRNLMTQGQGQQLDLQTKQIQVDQAQQDARERANLAKLYAQVTGAPPTVAGTPTNPPAVAPQPNAAPVAPGDVAPIPNTAAAAPGDIAPIPNTGPPAAGAALNALMAPAAPAAPPAPAPALVAASVLDPFAKMPSYAAILQAAPTKGFAHIETIDKAKKAYYDGLKAQHDAQLGQINDLATIASTAHDEPTKFSAVAEAFRRNLISPEERDVLNSHPYDKAEWDLFQTQALDGKARLQEARDQINQKAKEAQDAFDAAKRPFELTKAQAEATKAGTEAKTGAYGSAAQGVQLLSDASQIPGFIAQQPAEIQPYLQKLGVLPLDNFKQIVGMAASKEVPKPTGVVSQEIESAGLKKAAEVQAELGKYQPVVSAVIKGDVPLENLDDETRRAITPMLIDRGYTGITSKLSDPERERLGDYDRALTVLQQTQDKVKNPDNRDLMGVQGGLETKLPWATGHKDLQSDLVTQQQQLKKFITNGSLRGVNPETLNQIFPNISSQPEHADHQIQSLIDTVTAEKKQYVQDLAGKSVPQSMKGTPAPQKPAASVLSPAQRSAVPTAQAPPGKMAGVAPDGKGGWKGVYFNAKDVDEARRQGVIVP